MTHVGPVLLILRTYALYNCSVRILSFMIGSAAVLAGIATVRHVIQLILVLSVQDFHSGLYLDKNA